MNKTQNPNSFVAKRISDLGKSHPEWMDLYETADFSAGVTEELISLLDTAPNGFSAGLIYGKLTVMQETAGLASLRVTSRTIEAVTLEAPTMLNSRLNIAVQPPVHLRAGVHRPAFKRAAAGH